MEIQDENKPAEEQPVIPAEEIVTDESTDATLTVHDDADHHEHDEIGHDEDFSGLSKAELLKRLEEAYASDDPEKVSRTIRRLRDTFREHAKEELEARRRAHEETKEDEEDVFMPAPDPIEERFEELVRKYNLKRVDARRNKEQEQKQNLKVKLQIIEELKSLADTSDSMQKAFEKLQDLQQRWRDTGAVPQGYADEVWKSWQHHRNRFFDVVKISRELRELDLKKNLELKAAVCEKAEALVDEPELPKALEALRKLNEEWREIGPAPKESNDPIWERFKAAADKVHARKAEFLELQKEQLQKNLDAKIKLCDEMDTLAAETHDSHKAWQDANAKVEEIFKQWRGIGFTPREDEGRTWKRFKEARLKFFRNRESYYAKLREGYRHNLQEKVRLCEEAEKMQTSTDWKNTANAYKRLQDEWKKIGPVPRKQSDKIWKRFKAAGDAFFDHRSKHFAEADAQLQNNMQLRETLIGEVNGTQLTEDINASKELLKQFRTRWSEMPQVPRNERDRLEKSWDEAMNKLFGQLTEKTGDAHVVERMKYEQLSQTEKGRDQIHRERMNIHDKIKRLQNEINTLETNLGFFGKSKGAQSLVADYQAKVDTAKAEIERLKARLKQIPRE